MLAIPQWLGHAERESRCLARFALAFVAIVVSALSVLPAAGDEVKAAPDEKPWTVEIVPGPSSNPPLVRTAVPKLKKTPTAKIVEVANVADEGKVQTLQTPAAPEQRNIDLTAYERVYNSIPFRRSEYNANRDYRHEATMELLLGQLRTKTITQISNHQSQVGGGGWGGSRLPWNNNYYYGSLYYDYRYSTPRRLGFR